MCSSDLHHHQLSFLIEVHSPSIFRPSPFWILSLYRFKLILSSQSLCLSFLFFSSFRYLYLLVFRAVALVAPVHYG